MAWYPWQDQHGNPSADSCGILFINAFGKRSMRDSTAGMHKRGIHGLRSRVLPTDNRASGHEPFDVHTRNGGPGQPISYFLPKMQMPIDKP